MLNNKANWRVLDGVGTAVRTLTALPLPGTGSPVSFPRALYWFPLVGLLLGAAVLGPAWIMYRCTQWPAGAASIMLAAGLVFTKGLHLDGLADWADGFLNFHDREKTLAIMKDPHTGAFGVAAVGLVLIVKWGALEHLAAVQGWGGVLLAYIISRTIQVELAASLPYARKEGGMAAPFVQGASWRHRVVAWLLAAGLAGLLTGPAAFGLLGGSWLLVRLLAIWYRKRIGGVTGDLLGASSELVETALFFVCAGWPELFSQPRF
jgi:adenosylcobinamide-GDP ribazoletransferase